MSDPLEALQGLSLSDLIDRIPLGICVVDEQLTIMAWNQTLAEWTGQSRAAMIGTSLEFHYPHLTDEPYRPLLIDLFRSGHPALFPARLYSYLLPILRPGEIDRFMLQEAQFRLLPGPQRLALISIRDVTVELTQLHQFRDDQARRYTTEAALRRSNETLERHVTTLAQLNRTLQAEIAARQSVEQELRDSEARTRAMLDAAIDAVITIDQQGMIVSANSATESMFGYTQEELLGQNVRILMPSPHRDRHDAFLLNYLSTGQSGVIGVDRLVEAVHKSGRRFPIELSIGSFLQGDRRMFVGIVRDKSGLRTEKSPAQEVWQQSTLATQEPVSAEQPAAADEPAGKVCRVLLAEDGYDNQRLISRLLEKLNVETTIVADGQAARQQVLEAWWSGQPYDIVLMDMQMPIMDGYEATRQLRSAGYPGCIVAITAHAMSGDRDKCLEAGCTDYLTKPIHRTALEEVLQRCAAIVP